jgi:hypothetical protein
MIIAARPATERTDTADSMLSGKTIAAVSEERRRKEERVFMVNVRMR